MSAHVYVVALIFAVLFVGIVGIVIIAISGGTGPRRLPRSSLENLVSEGQRLSNYEVTRPGGVAWTGQDVNRMAYALWAISRDPGPGVEMGDVARDRFRLLAVRLLQNGWRGTL